jgi:hypothetical protein
MFSKNNYTPICRAGSILSNRTISFQQPADLRLPALRMIEALQTHGLLTHSNGFKSPILGQSAGYEQSLKKNVIIKYR